MIMFYLCVKETPDDLVSVIDTFDTLNEAVEAMDLLAEHCPSYHFWIGQVPSRLQRLEAEPILY